MGDQAKLRRARTLAKLEKSKIDSFLATALADPFGRKYLWWLLEITKISANPFSNNALTTSFQCGELNVGQQILAHIIEVDPAGYVRMQQERANESAINAPEPDPDTDDSSGDDPASD
jgi:hypothetical protein